MVWLAMSIFMIGCFAGYLIAEAIRASARGRDEVPVVLYSAPGIAEAGTPEDVSLAWLQKEPRSIVAPLSVYMVRGEIRVLVLRKPAQK